MTSKYAQHQHERIEGVYDTHVSIEHNSLERVLFSENLDGIHAC